MDVRSGAQYWRLHRGRFYLLHLIRSTSFRTCLSTELKSFGTSFYDKGIGHSKVVP